ncbi:MAG: urease accessory protein UreF [Lachnospiraceae bacterium]
MQTSDTTIMADSERDGLLSLVELFQLSDSTFPVGTFNHSYGMEEFLFRRKIRRAKDFREWLFDYYRSPFRYGEGLALCLTYDALDQSDTDTVFCTVDPLLTVSVAATETRRAGILIAGQMIQLLDRIYPDKVPHLAAYQEAIAAGTSYGNPSIVYALLAHSKELSRQTAYYLYGYNVASTLVQNAVRSIPLGQKDGQVILHDLILQLPSWYETGKELTIDDLGASVPGLEIAQIRHETQPARLFMS